MNRKILLVRIIIFAIIAVFAHLGFVSRGAHAAGTPSSGPVIIDPFTSARTNDLTGDNRLWREAAPGQCVTVTSISGGLMHVSAPSSSTPCTGQMVDGNSGYDMAEFGYQCRDRARV